MKNDLFYLRHMLECIGRIEEDVAPGYDQFMKSHTLQDAVLRNLQIMAESTQRVSEELKEKCPEIEWHKISAFRNVLVHDYLGIDLDRIWVVVQEDVSVLKIALLALTA